MKMRNLYSVTLMVSLLSTLSFGQRITKTESNTIVRETKAGAETQKPGTVQPFTDAKGNIIQYRVAVSDKQYEALKKRNETSREALKLENLAPILSNRNVIGYSFTVSPAVMGSLDKFFGGKLVYLSASLLAIPWKATFVLAWKKTASAFPSTPSSVYSPLTYSPNGINHSAAAICGTQGSGTIKTVFIIGGGLDVRQIDTINNDATSIKTGHNANIYEAGLVADPAGDGVYLFGGKKSDGTLLDTIYKYNSGFAPVTGKLIPNTTNNLGKRAGVATVEANGKIYVFGGYNANGVLKEVIEFDGTTLNPTTNYQKADMPQALKYMTAIKKGSYIYIFGGQDSLDSRNQTVYQYDTTSNTWKTAGTLPAPGSVQLSSTTFATDRNGDIHAIYPFTAMGTGFGKVTEITSFVMTETTSSSGTTIGWSQNPNSFTTSTDPVGPFRYNYVTASCGDIYLIGGVYGKPPSGHANHENVIDKYAP